MFDALVVGIGGFVGCVFRYILSKAADALMPEFPVGTLVVNSLASLLAGVALAGASAGLLDERVRLLASVGFCGGLSTFSAFSAETFAMLQEREYLAASANVALNVSVSLVCVAIGYWITSLCITHFAE
ncbi:putative fluoride ion transporter CrcB [Actinomycetota bacterium]|nr:putative fluoride ion transporter CrcB [Actinomycetota bacterium]